MRISLHTRERVISLFAMALTPVSVFAWDGHVKIDLADRTYDSLDVERVQFVDEYFNFDPSGRSYIYYGAPLSPPCYFSAYVVPASGGYSAQAYSEASAVSQETPATETRVLAELGIGTISNPANSGVVRRYTSSFIGKFSGRGSVFADNYYSTIVFGNSGRSSMEVNGASRTVSQSDLYWEDNHIYLAGVGIVGGTDRFGDNYWEYTTSLTSTITLYPGQSQNIVASAYSESIMVSGDTDYWDFQSFVTPGPGGSDATYNLHTYAATATTSDWSTSSTWIGGNVANAACEVAYFGNVVGSRIVSVTSPITVGRVAFNHLGGSYTVDGWATLTFGCGSNEVGIDNLAGSNTISAPTTINNNFTIDVQRSVDTVTIGNIGNFASGVSFTKSGPGVAVVNRLPDGLVTVSAGTLRLNGAETPKVAAVEIGASSRLDLVGGDLIVDYLAIGGSPLMHVRELLVKGRGTGDWNGDGISASAISTYTSHPRALGYIESAQYGGTTFSGRSIDSTAVLVKFTFAGDASLNGLVAFEDLLALSQNYGSPDFADWSEGDFNYDGLVTFEDLLTLSQNYGYTGSLHRGDGDSDPIYEIYSELRAGAPWILADALAHPEGQELFAPYQGSFRPGYAYTSQLSAYNLSPAPEPGLAVIASAVLLVFAPVERRRFRKLR